MTHKGTGITSMFYCIFKQETVDGKFHIDKFLNNDLSWSRGVSFDFTNAKCNLMLFREKENAQSYIKEHNLTDADVCYTMLSADVYVDKW